MDNDFLPLLFICIEGIVPRQGSTSRFILLYFRQDCSRHAGRSPPSFSRSSLGSLSAIGSYLQPPPRFSQKENPSLRKVLDVVSGRLI